jgi:glucose/arabinose dehydrogenase
MRRSVLGVVVLIVALAVPAVADAAFHLQRKGTFRSPVHVTAPQSASGGTLFIVEQQGRIIRRRSDGSRNLFLDIRSRVSCCGERGLLSMAFAPDWELSRHFVVYFTNNDGDIVVARYRADDAGRQGIETTHTRLFAAAHPGFSNHNGGQVTFGPDGLLYVGLGDGGGSCDPNGNAQDLDSRLGKILRYDMSTSDLEVFMYGLRNPWRFSFSRLDDSFWVGDVGQDAWEEINRRGPNQLEPAEPWNAGWDEYEGRELASSSSGCAPTALNPVGGLVDPVTVYSHGPGHCSVTGGFVYSGDKLGNATGWYFYADYCTGVIWRLQQDDGSVTRRVVRDTSLNITSFGEGPNGALYVVSHGGGLFRLVRT